MRERGRGNERGRGRREKIEDRRSKRGRGRDEETVRLLAFI